MDCHSPNYRLVVRIAGQQFCFSYAFLEQIADHYAIQHGVVQSFLLSAARTDFAFAPHRVRLQHTGVVLLAVGGHLEYHIYQPSLKNAGDTALRAIAEDLRSYGVYTYQFDTTSQLVKL